MPSGSTSLAFKEPRSAERDRGLAPVRVLLIAPSLDILGGQAVQANYLLSFMGDAPEIAITFLPINPRPPKPFRWISGIRFLRTSLKFVQYTSRLFWEARKHQVLHIFSAGLYSYTLWTIPALLAGRLYGKKVILNYHDGQAEQHIQEWRTARPTIALADRIVTPSYFLVDVFAKHGIPAQSIFNIMDASWFKYRKRRSVRPVFLTNRILEPLYNVECVLRAFRIIQANHPEASLTVAHDGPHRASLERYARELQLRNTQFVGKVPREKVADLYDAHDIYLTSPNIDCMPVSLLECFAAGLPIVATRAGGIPYIVKDRETALLVEINDHEALAERAMELLRSPDLVDYLTENGRRELQRYDWRPVREQWKQLYQELAESK